jgi:hypothetical protein
MKNVFASTIHKSFRAGFWSCILLACAVAAAGQRIPQINASHDPYQVYGGCSTNFSGYISKAGDVEGIGRTLTNVTAIDVLVCRPFDGPGGDREVPCPAGSPYAHCAEVDNDGLANHILLGILEVTPDNDPLGQYGGCAAGAGFRAKTELLKEAGSPLRDIDNIVVIECHAPDGAGGTTFVPCPTARNPYAACLQNHNDGIGNSVKVGVVKSYSAGDPYSLYGGCYTDTDYRSKASLVTEAGKSLDEVVAIHIGGCAPSFGAPQEVPQVVPCNPNMNFPGTYNYCLHTGSDGKGNAITIGVITNPH